MLFYIISSYINVKIFPYLPVAWQNKMTEKRVIQTVRDAYHHIPFYHSKYDQAGVDINSIKHLEDLKKLPLLTKEEIRQNFPEYIVRKGTPPEKCHKSTPSGSSGQPLIFIISPYAYAYYLAVSSRIYSMIGYKPWEKSCYIRCSQANLPDFFAKRQVFISSMQPVDQIITELKKTNPDMIDAYPTTMLDMAINIKPDDLKYIKPRRITLNSQRSTVEIRRYLSDVFNCPVYDEYSTEETWSIAAECRNHNYHIFIDSIWLEFLNDSGLDARPGEIGEVIITTTRSKTMPFIRYAIGDLGRPSLKTCNCGYNLPVFESIDGRSDDWLVLPSGILFDPAKIESMVYLSLRNKPRLLDGYRVIQKERDYIEFHYTKGLNFNNADLKEILDDLKKVMNEEVTFIPEEGIPEGCKKRRQVESCVKKDINLPIIPDNF
jgi:phenylacetate-CoA ligase